MCGIAGFIDQGQPLERRKFQLDAMLDAIIHRGPDDSGTYMEHQVALGHRRLAIIDLSPGGHQPMRSISGRFIIVFNGEIYNHKELREGLNCNGVNFRGHSDTEVLLELIERDGLSKALTQCIGMFAFAIWDKREGTLSIARDRFGEKPLYYGWNNGVFLFGSELKSLKTHANFDNEIDQNAIHEYLRWGYIPAPLTIYKNTHKLPAGCWLQLDSKSITAQMLPSPVAYWSLIAAVQRNRVRPFKGDYEEAVDQLEQRLLDAVRLQAIADVPVGAFLSGGVDSSIVAALMQRSTDSKVMTFSIGMPDDSIDESHHAALVAKHLGSEHIEHRIQPEEALDTMLLLPKIWDEPFADSSQVPTYLLSRLARKHVTVALSGDGGDELFLGYNHYRRINSVWKSRTFRHFPFRTFLELVNSKVQSDKLNNYYDRAKNVVDAWDMPTKISLARHWSNRYNSRAWPTEECHPELKYFDYSIANNLSPVETVALWDGCQYLPDDILVKVDRAAMAVSLETRAPLLDHRLVEFALSLPVEYRLKGKINKRVLRDVLYRYVPQSLVDRPKQGFTIPIAKWLRNELRESASQHLANLCHLPGFNKKIIKSMWLEHCDGKRDHSDQLWGLIMLGSFYEKL